MEFQCWQQGPHPQFFSDFKDFWSVGCWSPERVGREVPPRSDWQAFSAFPCIMGRNIIPVIHLTNSLPLQRHGPRAQICLVCQPHFPSLFASSWSVVAIICVAWWDGKSSEGCGSQRVCVPCQVIACFQWFVAVRIGGAVVCREECAAAFAAPVILSWLVCSWSLGLLLPVLTASTVKSEGFLQLVALLLQEREPNFWQS